MILANDFSSGLIRFQKLLAQMANRVLLDLARAVCVCVCVCERAHVYVLIRQREGGGRVTEEGRKEYREGHDCEMFCASFIWQKCSETVASRDMSGLEMAIPKVHL